MAGEIAPRLQGPAGQKKEFYSISPFLVGLPSIDPRGLGNLVIGDGCSAPTYSSAQPNIYSTVIGNTSASGMNYSIVLGYNNKVPTANTSGYCISIGSNQVFSTTYAPINTVVIGNQIACQNANSVAIGDQVQINGSGNSQSTAVGATSIAKGTNSTALGYAASCSIGGYNTVIGAYSTAGSNSNITILGGSAGATGIGATSIGYASNTYSSNYAIALGAYAGCQGTAAITLNGNTSVGSTSNCATGNATFSVNWAFNSGAGPIANNSILMATASGTVYASGSGFANSGSNLIYISNDGNSGSSLWNAAPNTANASYQIGIGYAMNLTRYGQVMIKTTAPFSSANDSILSYVEMRANTTTATSTEMFLNYPTNNARLILQNNSLMYFKAMITAKKTGASDAAAWTIEGSIQQGATAGSTVILGTPVSTSMGATSGATSGLWAVTATADTTNGSLKLTVTGQASTTIHWYAKIDLIENTW